MLCDSFGERFHREHNGQAREKLAPREFSVLLSVFASVRFALIGLGWVARTLHLRALERVPGADLVGAYGRSADARESWARETGIPAFETFDELVERAQPDVVVVATPPGTHADLCAQVLEAGAHVICEKPFVSTLEEADRVLAVAEASGREVMVNHSFREQRVFKAIKERIDSGAAGRLVFCQIWQLMDLAPWDEPVAWRRALANRTLFEAGIQLVDLLVTLYGTLPSGVYARDSRGFSEVEGDAIHLVTLDFPDGRLAQITLDRLCPAGTRYAELRADCEGASLRASLGGRALVQVGKKRAERPGIRLELASEGLAWEERGSSRKRLARHPRGSLVRATADLLSGAVRAFEQGQTPPSSGREARDVLAIIEAAYRSASTGRRVELGEIERGVAGAAPGASVPA
jgi:predicted dehydrogenase